MTGTGALELTGSYGGGRPIWHRVPNHVQLITTIASSVVCALCAGVQAHSATGERFTAWAPGVTSKGCETSVRLEIQRFYGVFAEPMADRLHCGDGKLLGEDYG